MSPPRRLSTMALRSLALAAAFLSAMILSGAPQPARAAETWLGAGVMAGGKGYVSTPMGQVSYRDIGPRDAKVPLLLIHQAWMSMVEFAEIQDALAALGYRSIAVDTPGYGMSDPVPMGTTIPQLADDLVPVLDGLKINKAIVVGHHTGSLLAVAFAARHPERVTALVLHGNPAFTKAESEAALAQPDYERTPKADGSHLSKFFTYPVPGDPDPNTPEKLRNRTWMLLSMFMMGPDIGHWAVYHYDMEPDLKAVRAPALILTDGHDMIHYLDQRLAKERPDFKYEVFSDGTGMQMMSEPKRWAQMVADYAAAFEH
ncbi:MAG TPA: alpha/beta fold hydrolase [Caulobacteraceae bacterium]|nr:alpha/beta fold hydrolase [Caulobacteraceae bacterium]